MPDRTLNNSTVAQTFALRTFFPTVNFRAVKSCRIQIKRSKTRFPLWNSFVPFHSVQLCENLGKKGALRFFNPFPVCSQSLQRPLSQLIKNFELINSEMPLVSPSVIKRAKCQCHMWCHLGTRFTIFKDHLLEQDDAVHEKFIFSALNSQGQLLACGGSAYGCSFLKLQCHFCNYFFSPCQI